MRSTRLGGSRSRKRVYRQCNSDPIAELKSDSRDIGFLSLRKAKGEPDGGSGGGVGDPGRDYIIHDDTDVDQQISW
jgi:hypothetical protein